MKTLFDILRRNEGARLPVGAAGYCWGDKHTLKLATGFKANGKPLINAGFTAHPSLVSFYDDIERIRVPVSIAVGNYDNQISLKKAEDTHQILEAKPEGQKGEVQIYEGYSHGFACRVDPKNFDPKGADQAKDQALAWH